VDCNVYANGPYLTLHASQEGPFEVDIGHAGPVTDLLTGKTVGVGPKFLLPLAKAQTRVLVIPGYPQ